jgi:hypothetical protein
MKQYIIIFLLTILILFLSGCATKSRNSRSNLRPLDKKTPKIYVHWADNNKKVFKRKNSHYQRYPLFETFDQKIFDQNLVPEEGLAYRHDKTKKISKQKIDLAINTLLQEIIQEKKDFKFFTVLQRTNFSRKKKCGLIVLRFKDHPFVLKLLMEQPKTFVNPYCKGFEPITFFFLAGGTNRHITGITRIPNLHYVQQQINSMPKWRNIVHLPRKWYWQPKNNRYITITGKNIRGGHATTTIPSTFCVIADAIDVREYHNLSQIQRNRIIMDFCHDIKFYIDPHHDNFVVVQANKISASEMWIIDTEHFPSIVGIKKDITFKNHVNWYVYLAKKCFSDTFLRTKKQRKDIHTQINKLKMPYQYELEEKRN